MIEESESDIWSDDLLHRKKEAEFILNFLLNRTSELSIDGKSRSYVLNIDGSWGQGKTFFLDHFHRQLQANGYLSVYVNAWKDDHADDPMIAVMSAIDESLNQYLSKKPALRRLWETAKKSGIRVAIALGTGGLKKLVSKVAGEGFEEAGVIISEYVPDYAPNIPIDGKSAAKNVAKAVEKIIDQRSEAALAKFKDTKLSAQNFRRNLADFISLYGSEKDNKIPLFILVDELDRCRPPYAIATLERIKHFFDVPNVVFVIATDSGQLKHSIKAIYGQDFDSNKYLRRFYDRTYYFQAPSNDKLIDFLFETRKIVSPVLALPHLKPVEFFKEIAAVSGLSPRDIEQCYEHLRTICTIWVEKTPIQLLYLLPLIVSFHQSDTETFDILADGEGNDQKIRKLRILDFKFDLQIRDRTGYKQASTEVSEVLINLLKYSRLDLKKVGMNDAGGSFGHWAQQQMMNEFQILHDGIITNNKPIYSVMNDYAKLVRNAGQLTWGSAEENAL